MPTYSQSLRVELITPGTEANTWGTITNNNFAYVFDRAIAGYETVSVTSADQALTTFNGPTATGSANQAVYAILRFTTTTVTTAFTVYAPPVSKQYIIWNDTAYTATVFNWLSLGPPITTPPGAQSVTIAPGDRVMIFTDGTSFYSVKAGNVTGTVAIANGGTGQTTQQAAINALVGAQTANRVLRSDGTNSTLAQVALGTDVSGTLAIANGGTNTTATPTAGGVAYGTGSAYAITAAGTAGQVLTSNGAAAPTWGSFPGAVSSVSFGTTGLTPNTATTGAVTVGGTLGTANGGTNLTTFGANQVFYASSASVMSQSSALTFDGTILYVNDVAVGRGAAGISSNTAIGINALDSNTTGAANTAVGQVALSTNTSGEYNVAVGSYALYLNNSGSSNTAIGDVALYGNVAGDSNSAFGRYALGLNTGSSNTAVGRSAGSLITTGSKNTILGRYDGNQGGLDIRTASNYIVLSDGDGNPRAYWNAANATFNGDLNTTGTITQNSVAVVTTTGTQTLSNKTFNTLEVASGYQITWDSGSLSDYSQKISTKTIFTIATGVMEFLSPGTQYLYASAGTAGSAGLWLAPGTGGSGQVGTALNYNLNFYRNQNLYQTFDTNGVVLAAGRNLGVGGTTPSTSGAGITFPATQSASSDVNTLDDYEEGTFTPTVYGLTTPGTGSYNVYGQVGNYVKIGNMVKVQIRLSWSSHTGTGDMGIQGLPFSSTPNVGVNDPVALTCSNIALTANNVMTADKLPYGPTISLRQYPTGGGTETNVPMDTSGIIQISCVYLTNT